MVRRSFIFCLYCGLRFCDVKDLTYKNIDYSNKLLKFEQSKTKGHSSGSGIVIPLNDGLLSIIGEPPTDVNKDVPIFNLPSYESCCKSVKRWVKRAGIDKHISWHVARHSFADKKRISRDTRINIYNFFLFSIGYKTKIFNFTHKTNQAVYMKKKSPLKQYILPFVCVNTLMAGSWAILVTLFRMSGMEIPSCLSKQYGTLILFGISALISFLWIYCPHFKELYRNSEKNDNIGLPVGSLGMAICMLMFAETQYSHAAIAYFTSTAAFILFLYWDLYKMRLRKQKKTNRKNTKKPYTHTE